jgi:hypothetical protein
VHEGEPVIFEPQHHILFLWDLFYRLYRPKHFDNGSIGCLENLSNLSHISIIIKLFMVVFR